MRWYGWLLFSVAFVVLFICDALADEQRRRVARWRRDD